MSKTTIPTGGITADAINGTLIADDAINSEHYTDASIDTAHIGNSQVTSAKVSGVGGLHTLITSTTIGSEGSTFTVDNCFTDTYNKYLVFFEQIRNGNDSTVDIGLRTGGSSGSAGGSTLGGAFHGYRMDGQEMAGSQANGATARIMNTADNDNFYHGYFHVFYPTTTDRMTSFTGKVAFREGSTTYAGFNDFGYISISTEDHTGFSLIAGTGNFNTTACTVNVYGITNGS